MGSLNLPENSIVYIDSQILIYSVESHPKYGPALLPLWTASRRGTVQIVTSELAMLEVLVRPIRDSDQKLRQDYEDILLNSDVRLQNIDRPILLDAANLRATVPTLRTPDAIHAATARAVRCDLFLTNDRGLKKVGGLPVVFLEDVVST